MRDVSPFQNIYLSIGEASSPGQVHEICLKYAVFTASHLQIASKSTTKMCSSPLRLGLKPFFDDGWAEISEWWLTFLILLEHEPRIIKVCHRRVHCTFIGKCGQANFRYAGG